MNTTSMAILLTALVAPTLAHAESYLERKDTERLAAIERALARSAPKPTLFDGERIAADADLHEVERFVDRLLRDVKGAVRSAQQLSAAGRARPKAGPLLEKLEARVAYANRLLRVYKATAAAARTKAKADEANAQQRRQAYFQTCRSFREQLTGDDRNRLKVLAALARGNTQLRVTAKELEPTARKFAAICARSEYADIGRACGVYLNVATSKEGDWCAAVAQADTLLAAADAHRARQKRDAEQAEGSVESLKQRDGWVRREGATRWAQLNATPTLKRSVETLAATWTLPGRPCAGPHCRVVKSSIDRLYGKQGKLLKVRHRADWKVVQNRLGIPTHRYRSGYVLVKVEGEPYCQLRSWTMRQAHQGGGRYAASRGARIGYVRWQACR